MSIDSIETYKNNYYTQNLNNNLTNSTNFTQKNVTHLSKDTVQISSNNTTSSAKKKGLSTLSKVALGIIGTVGTIYAGIVGHRMLNRPTLEKCAQNFSEIFRRDVSKDEAKKIINNYQELFKIKDNEEFIKKAFEQVKKDYGYEKLDIPLKIEYRKNKIKLKDLKTRRLIGSWHPQDCSITYYSLLPIRKNHNNIFKWEKKDIINILIHEFQHAKQSEIAYRTSPSEYIKVITSNKFEKLKTIENNLRKILKNPQKYIKEEAKEQKPKTNNLNEVSNKYYKLFEDFPPISPNSNNYKLGKEYIENQKHYINMNQDFKKYKKQIIEKEAYTSMEKFTEIYNFFANPWRLF